MKQQGSDQFYELNPAHTHPARVKKERDKARELKASRWWQEKIAKGVCHYCEKVVGAQNLTLDHIVPIARGGESAKANVVPACASCNAEKKLHTPVDLLFQQIQNEKK